MKRILLPYLFWCLVSVGFMFVVGHPVDRWIVKHVIPFAGFSNSNQPLWFLWALLISEIVGVSDLIVGRRKGMISNLLPGLIFLGVTLSGEFFLGMENPLMWRQVVFGVVFIEIGKSVAAWNVISYLNSKKWIPLIVLVVGCVAGFVNGKVSVYSSWFGRFPVLLLVSGALLSCFWMFVFKKLDASLPGSMGVLGKGSLFVLVTHFFFHHFAACLGGSSEFLRSFMLLTGVVIGLGVYIVVISFLGYVKKRLVDTLSDWLFQMIGV